MTRIDLKNFEGQIIIASDDRGRWAYQTVTRRSRNIRTAGSLPVDASAHTLLAVALTAALRSISRKQADQLVGSAHEQITKPRIVVVSDDRTFCDALAALMTAKQGKRLKTGKNFLMVLAQQLARFQITFQTDTESTANLILKNWSVAHVIDPKLIATLPAVLSPSVVSSVV